MAKKKTRRLVIDASVAQASGGKDAIYPTSKNCRDFLDTVLAETGHEVVMTLAIREEWNKHQSNFAKNWRAAMIARKRLSFVNVAVNDELHQKLANNATHEKTQVAILKDCHLIDAALATDKNVSSLDNTVRGLFGKACKTVFEIKAVVWVNPDKSDEVPLEWLKNGAKAEKTRMLEFWQGSD